MIIKDGTIRGAAGVTLFLRRAKPMRLTAAGLRLLRLAEKILPVIDAVQANFFRLRIGRVGRMHIAIECHACFEWLFPVLEAFRKLFPDFDVDISPGLAFDALPVPQKEDVHVVISSDPEQLAGVAFTPLFDCAPVLVASSKHKLAQKAFIDAQNFRGETSITYPVDRARLDMISQLLTPAKVVPAQLRPVELTAVILMLRGSNRGGAVLPDWVVREVKYSLDYITQPLKQPRITRILYAATRSYDLDKPFVGDLIRLAGQEAKTLQLA